MPRHATKTAHDYRDPASFRSKWRERCIVLPEALVTGLFEFHLGQFSAIYKLASSGMRNLVSLSMIDAAMQEGETYEGEMRASAKAKRRPAVAKAARELKALLDDLIRVRHFWKEHDARSAGMDVDRYEYDDADYGLTAKLEDEIEVRSG